jgi:hypothetical protein
VLAAGGATTNTAIASAEIYDPATGMWTATGTLQTPRASHTATLLPNGKVLAAGGSNFTNDNSGGNPVDSVLASAEIFDPATGLWTPTGSLNFARESHTASLLPNGKVLAAGGDSFFLGQFPTTAELYDPATGKWVPTLPLVSGRTEHIAAVLANGKVLVAGGFNNSDVGATAELFDPASVVAGPVRLELAGRQMPGLIQFNFRNTPGLGFTVLSAPSPNTPAANWTNLGEAAEISPGHYQFTDGTIAPPQRFYRVRLP